MVNFNTNILMVGTEESYLSRSVRIGLTEKHFHVTFSNGDIQALKNSKTVYHAFIVFADEELCHNLQFLVFLKDLAIEKDIPVFVIGYADETNAISAMMPEYLLQKNFYRPINANEVEREIIAFLSQNTEINKKKILVVDDSPTDLRSMRRLLGDRYQVILASSGASAIVYLSQEHPDLILLDYEMPIVDGKKVLEMIRGEADYANTPVIFLTARGDRKSILSVVGLHPDGYLLKSMELGMIRSAIDEFFEKRKSLEV